MICSLRFITSKFHILKVGVRNQLAPLNGNLIERVCPQGCKNAHLTASKASGGLRQLVTVRVHCAARKAANRRKKLGCKTCRGITATVSSDQKLYTCKWSQINQ